MKNTGILFIEKITVYTGDQTKILFYIHICNYKTLFVVLKIKPIVGVHID